MGKRGAISPRPFVISKMTCVSGGSCSAPLVLPTKIVDGLECVLVSAYSEKGWLPAVLSGQVRGVAVDVVREVQDLVLAELSTGEAARAASTGEAARAASTPRAAGDALTPLSKANGSSESLSSVPAPNSEKKVGRGALGIDDDSDEEELCFATPTKKRTGCSSKLATCWTSVKLGDAQITVRRIDKGRGLLIPVEEDLPRLLQHMLTKLQDTAGVSAPRRELRGPVERTADDKARVRWSFQSDAWEVCYTDETGKKRRTVKGFSVSRTDVDDKALSGAAYTELRERVLQKARKAWNTWDHSSEPRYDLAA